MAQFTFGQPSDQISDTKETATDQSNKAADRFAEQGRQAGERMQEVADNFKDALNTSLRDQPMATLAAAAIVGFVLGALWKS
jgi:ElaB/YqjD/DUF883 family membrane-anchored ribosome-binding protein